MATSSILSESLEVEEIPVNQRRFDGYYLVDSEDGAHLKSFRSFRDLQGDEARSVDSQGNLIETSLATGSSDMIRNVLENDLVTNFFDATEVATPEPVRNLSV